MTLYIQNMVSLRCKILVKEELHKLGLTCNSLELGEVHLDSAISGEQRQKLKQQLHNSGLELLDDKQAILVEKIKNIIVEMIHYSDDLPHINFSVYLTEKLNRDYHVLSEIFSKTKGITIEHYIILHKIERVKELIMYDEFNLTEIAFKLHYSSVAHLSNQFKKTTGLTPSFFKNLKIKDRQNLENI